MELNEIQNVRSRRLEYTTLFLLPKKKQRDVLLVSGFLCSCPSLECFDWFIATTPQLLVRSFLAWRRRLDKSLFLGPEILIGLTVHLRAELIREGGSQCIKWGVTLYLLKEEIVEDEDKRDEKQ